MLNRLAKIEAGRTERIKAARDAASIAGNDWIRAHATEADQDAYWRFVVHDILVCAEKRRRAGVAPVWPDIYSAADWNDVVEWARELGPPTTADVEIFKRVYLSVPPELRAVWDAAWLELLPGESPRAADDLNSEAWIKSSDPVDPEWLNADLKEILECQP